MYLSNLKLWDFRKFGNDDEFDLEKPDLDLNFNEGLNVLIGENDSGKTAIIDAIKITLKTHSYEWFRITPDDFYNNSTRLRIELHFDNLVDEEAKNFTEWLGWMGEGDEAKPFLRLIYDVKRRSEDNRILPTDVKAGIDTDGNQLPAETKEKLKVTYLKPLRDAQTELVSRKNSRLSKILQGHEAFKDIDSHYLVDLFANFNQAIEGYFQGRDLDENELPDQRGKYLKQEIDGFVKRFYDQSKEVEFGVIEGKLQNILEKLELSIKDTVNPGLGTQNRLFMASELLHLNKANWDGIRLGLIEELEAHLHPQAQMQVIEALQQQDHIQLILTTHSPNLASKVKLENLIICNNSTAFPMGNSYTHLDEDDYKFLEKFLDATKANLFFAKGVIFVEGWAEELLISSLAKELKANKIIAKDLTEAGVSVVNVASTAFLRYSKIFCRKSLPNMNIPISIITDVDIKEYKKVQCLDKDGIALKNETGEIKHTVKKRKEKEVTAESIKKTEALKEKFDLQNIKSFIAPNWTLEYSIYKSKYLSEKFQDVTKKIHPRIDTDDFEQALANKLISKSLEKTKIAYQLAYELEEDSKKDPPEITIDVTDDSLKYLIEGIQYACGN